ncbi:MAG: hypothetical protein LBQ66_10880 [Planctomycetaceae bacterium]|nr:hypothetical protein [Planctomycetaceae bacterium]
MPNKLKIFPTQIISPFASACLFCKRTKNLSACRSVSGWMVVAKKCDNRTIQKATMSGILLWCCWCVVINFSAGGFIFLVGI